MGKMSVGFKSLLGMLKRVQFANTKGHTPKGMQDRKAGKVPIFRYIRATRHQGERECSRSLRQIAAGIIPLNQTGVLFRGKVVPR